MSLLTRLNSTPRLICVYGVLFSASVSAAIALLCLNLTDERGRDCHTEIALAWPSAICPGQGGGRPCVLQRLAPALCSESARLVTELAPIAPCLPYRYQRALSSLRYYLPATRLCASRATTSAVCACAVFRHNVQYSLLSSKIQFSVCRGASDQNQNQM